MDSYKTQVLVKEKIENTTEDKQTQFSVFVTPTEDGASGSMALVSTNPLISEFFTTGELYDVVVTRRQVS